VVPARNAFRGRSTSAAPFCAAKSVQLHTSNFGTEFRTQNNFRPLGATRCRPARIAGLVRKFACVVPASLSSAAGALRRLGAGPLRAGGHRDGNGRRPSRSGYLGGGVGAPSKRHGVAVIHDRFAAHISENLRVESERIRVVRNWTHLEDLDLPPRLKTREKYNWSPDETIALHAGNMGVKQGLENLVAAAKAADERGERVRFVLLGKGNQREVIRAAAAGIRNIQFIDPLPDLEYQATMAAADVLIVNEKPGVAEMAVPSKLTSYFSTGLPVVVATDEGSVTAGEIESSGGGLRVDAGDPEALLEAIRALAADELRASELGRRGRAFREEVLSEDAAVSAYANWLSGLVDKRRVQLVTRETKRRRPAKAQSLPR
jgi:glycosyltransferase involved in cell wall biosynthesis